MGSVPQLPDGPLLQSVPLEIFRKILPLCTRSMATVLVLGSGGREHALSWKLTQSTLVKQVFVAPGNAGTQIQPKTTNVALDLKNFQEISDFCKEKYVSLVIVGPEDPLASGISDFMINQGIPCFGPRAQAAEIEASKDFAKQFMVRHNIPTARYQSFTESDAAIKYIKESPFPALVVKASGLAAGKGVVVAKTQDEACQAVKDILCNKTFGKAGDVVIVEEMLYGEEVSCLAFCDGTNIALMPAAQDHKQLLDGDTGTNTGGMGAVCPYPLISEADLETIKKEILQKAVDGMKSEGRPYVGVLYAGLMLTKQGPKVLEFNCRFGDPETQSILPLMKSDLYSVCKACVEGRLPSCMPEFYRDKFVVGVVKVSGGYPGSYKKNMEISTRGIEAAKNLGNIIFHAGTTMKDGKLLTNGGRVLAVMATNSDLSKACDEAQKGASFIQFTDSYHRSDIGFRISNKKTYSSTSLSYKDSGVDIDAGNSLVKVIKPLAEASKRQGCMSSLGGFGALFDLKASGYKDPVLVSGTDGVGTKLKIAQEIGNHSTIGKDLVAMCVNDILAHGAEPLFFLDYFATGHLDVTMAAEVISGIAEGCKEAGCSLVGGETAEMPGMYKGGEYDLAGFAVGAVERDQILPKVKDIQKGDVLIGLLSSGIHSNGFSLVRKVVEKTGLTYDMPSPLGTGKSLGEELIVPTRIYVKQVLPLLRLGKVKAFCHITGGGLVENLPRILSDNLAARLDALKWEVPPVFGWLSYKGNIAAREMLRTFNCGIGGVLIVEQSHANTIIDELSKEGNKASIIGEVTTTDEENVVVDNLSQALSKSWKCPQRNIRKKKVGVLISGSGTNLQALIDHTTDNNNSSAEITLVISNKAGVMGLERAQKAGIETMVINHKDYGDREKFDDALHKALTEAEVDIVCLAGFMRILTGGFVNKWNGRMLNIHPSLLPSFKGHNPHEQVIETNVRISGCTVHFVAEEVDAGAIIVQESVPVYPGDSVTSLANRVKSVEHEAFPRALELVASEQAILQEDGSVTWQLA
ncbi:hypothetical protein FSP39_016387 [Pinctada imbricata]|uniref:Trifunctional purine biosynthetic protein adenosine-3 n=1 Tax=Pinctada imbricata TaxID=66713 RepID=A0AA88YMZ9_PINIB|nr:hypothetical protein FSP39_016387 [Pinctada imbricata]